MGKKHHHGGQRGSRVAALVATSREIRKVHELLSTPRYAAQAIRAAETGNKRLAAAIVKRAGVTRPFTIRVVEDLGIGVCFKVKGNRICYFLNIL